MKRGPSTSIPSKGLGMTTPCTRPLSMGENGQKPGHMNADAAKSLQSCLTLHDPMDCSPSGFSVHGTSQARILEGVTMPSSRDLTRPGNRTHISYISCIDRWVPPH